ncbi:hypothetical protein BZG36_03901 [Bifiguratus adelaidae]|uniref:Sulfide:quinone oxidoreductase, mitochondrial n=1 Tax=Bifiguratus adelaidae TaxID=1938954 RepID=A0A261XXL0_9FUNG|nr:hypothetical protein BZG36_03901 [Bifiguratus adelaidae]
MHRHTVSLARSVRGLATQAPTKQYKVVVVGGGPGGLSVSSTLSEQLGHRNVAVIEPSAVHYYQPMWTYVGGGLKSLADSARPMADVMPNKVDWVRAKVTQVQPEQNTVTLSDGTSVGYEYLVVAAGIQINWDKIKGLKEALGKNGVSSNYSADTVEKTWRFIQNVKGGNAIFTFPGTPVKCPGAPVKIVYLAEEAFRDNGVRDKVNVMYNSALPKIFGVDHYGKELQKIADARNITTNFQHELVEVRGDDKKAFFKTPDAGIKEFDYEFLHVAPPQGPPAFIKESGLGDAAGWVDVSKETLRHNKYPNIYALGDSSSAPTSKTAAAITVESAVVKHNLAADLAGKPLSAEQAAKYDGYTSCPLIVGKNKLILAEFSGYTGKPMETFPVDQRTQSRVAQYLNKEIIPEIYWNGLLTGAWTGPARFRNIFAAFKAAQ